MKTIIYFIRHAQSFPSYKYTHDKWPLSDLGHQQASKMIPVIKELKLDKIYSSPFIRCIDTIKPYCDFYQVPIKIVDDLRERNVANELVDDFTEIWRKSWEDFSFSMPGCESSLEAQNRFSKSIKLIVEDDNKGRILGISSHGNVIGLFLNHIDSKNHIEEANGIRNPDIIKIIFENGKYSWDRGFNMEVLNKITTPMISTPIEYEDKIVSLAVE